MNQDKVEEQIFQMESYSVRLPPSHIKPSAHHQCPPHASTPSQTAGKDDAKNPNSSRVASPSQSVGFYPFPPKRQILKDFPAQPPMQGAAWGREDPASLDGDRKDTRFSFGARGREEYPERNMGKMASAGV